MRTILLSFGAILVFFFLALLGLGAWIFGQPGKWIRARRHARLVESFEPVRPLRRDDE